MSLHHEPHPSMTTTTTHTTLNGELKHEHVLHLLEMSSNLGNATTTCFLPFNLNAQPFLSSLSPISLCCFLPHQPCLLYGLHTRRLLWSISWLRTRLRLAMAAISRMPPFNERYCPSLLCSGVVVQRQLNLVRTSKLQ